MGMKMGVGEDMTPPTKGVVWVRGVLASVVSIVVFGFIWVAVQPTHTYVLTEHAADTMEKSMEMEPSAEDQVLGGDGVSGIVGIAPVEEYGEVMEQPLYKSPSARSMDRAAAIKRSEDLVAVRDNPEISIELRTEADRQLQEHKEANFPTASAESPIREPKNGDSHAAHGAPTWDEILRDFVSKSLPYLFMAVQGVIAWRTKKKLAEAKQIPTDSFINRVDEKLIAKYRTQKTNVKTNVK